MNKKGTILLLAVLCLFAAVGCGASGEKAIIGTWVEEYSDGGITATAEHTFNKDGTMETNLGNGLVVLRGTYLVDGENISTTVTVNGEDATERGTFKVEKNVLILQLHGARRELKRKK